ncbi:mitochondrial elongation factor MEF2 [Kluyveromyces lactis]|uniref:Ribosome-releasing factor 2, mitochondrial n=1 Tax=Kluyveromyces lactis (strain ATCC 8585 / CBS 2359 / DSM 70799 / NBRC 1267 / NRRL Y-1140 / WM37) TaxID=284590 RepID=RRF2M_KLULA|nr:uncharacterized protein KLLA0_F13992g [Kluyveromyces lactis]Q6CK29.1 RecName: Full=Ribosome-releasing factor 2, mitochondrial; Short=RRF2mt; AltName: Full=Elongation factor G 2, mitochondrial; Short=EF-G2mt; Short=mEF-G 2 [Kluyveromyces lactis NRRL Y-1140]CAG98418.1 KLLA0F13992p [Kluyveromyces lactis]|eukprot:XP_455710.1 uncharacterized protein KLLA0_F13992g [Kluyveromyces lactis]
MQHTMSFRIFLRRYATKHDLSKVRNIGIIAHIDAGKTTTTERMLYYSGKINRIGDVDQGDTITDYLPQERSRGITIQSAAISFNWKKDYKINLIDTPGHADFTFEVIRSLKVLDSCVTILDSVAGVEAQTEKVWKQSSGLPKICFLNKMDRVGAGFSRTVKELVVKMNTRALLINTPIFQVDPVTNESKFSGVLDLIYGKQLIWDTNDPDKINVTDVDENHDCYEYLVRGREALVETLGETDESIVEHFFNDADGEYLNVSPEVLNASIRKATISLSATPVLCGASFRNIGVQPLLDAIANYLPSPSEARPPELNHKNVPITQNPLTGLVLNKNPNLCVALAFKVITDAIRGTMIFIRVYSGVLRSNHTVYNTTTGTKFKIGKLVRMHANVPEEVNELYPGDIGVLTGSNVSEHIRTGDTIVTHVTKKDGLRSFDKNVELTLKINPIEIPPPVFNAAIEPKTLGNKKPMEQALSQLTREDPSLVVTHDEETGQTLLSGMGELHLDIARDRLLNELNAQVDVERVIVSYKETLNHSTQEKTLETDDGYKITAVIEPLDEEMKAKAKKDEEWFSLANDNNFMIMEKHTKYDPDKNWPFQVPYVAVVNALLPSSLVALQRGGKIGGFPLSSCVIRIKNDWDLPIDAPSISPLLTLSRQLFTQILLGEDQSNYSVLEPVMNVDVTVQQQDMGPVIQDLSSARKANILSIEDENTNTVSESNIRFQHIADKMWLPEDPTLEFAKLGKEGQAPKMVKAQAPLKEMVAYNNKIRSITQGRGSFNMYYHGMQPVTHDRLQSVLADYHQ